MLAAWTHAADCSHMHGEAAWYQHHSRLGELILALNTLFLNNKKKRFVELFAGAQWVHLLYGSLSAHSGSLSVTQELNDKAAKDAGAQHLCGCFGVNNSSCRLVGGSSPRLDGDTHGLESEGTIPWLVIHCVNFKELVMKGGAHFSQHLQLSRRGKTCVCAEKEKVGRTARGREYLEFSGARWRPPRRSRDAARLYSSPLRCWEREGGKTRVRDTKSGDFCPAGAEPPLLPGQIYLLDKEDASVPSNPITPGRRESRNPLGL